MIPPMYGRKTGAAPLPPSNIPNVVEWWRSDVGVTTIVNDVTDWAGMIQATVVSQATAGRRPDLVPNQLNGFPAIRFNGTQDNLFNGAVPAATQPYTFLLVYRKSDAFTTNDSIFGGTASIQGDGVNTTAGVGNLRQLSQNILGPAAAARAAVFVADGAGVSKAYFNESNAQLYPAQATNTTNMTNLVLGALVGNGANAISADLFDFSYVDDEVSADDINGWGAYVEQTFGVPWTGI